MSFETVDLSAERSMMGISRVRIFSLRRGVGEARTMVRNVDEKKDDKR